MYEKKMSFRKWARRGQGRGRRKEPLLFWEKLEGEKGGGGGQKREKGGGRKKLKKLMLQRQTNMGGINQGVDIRKKGGAATGEFKRDQNTETLKKKDSQDKTTPGQGN